MTERDQSELSSPTRPAVGTPDRAFPYTEHSWILQQLHQLAGDVGRLQESIETLKSDIGDQKKSLSGITHLLAFAAGAVVVIGAIIGFIGMVVSSIVENGIDRIVDVLTRT